MNKTICFNLNNEDVEVKVDPLRRLLDVIRIDLDLTGTKECCGEGECGSCVVFLNDVLVNSCMVPVAYAEGKTLVTIEGFKKTDRFNMLETCFNEAGAVQCGFCTTGMIMAANACLINNPNATLDEVKEALSGNLCRCTGYQMIFSAVEIAKKRGEGLW